MPTFPDLRRLARDALRPLYVKLAARGTTPIQLTYASLAVSVAAGGLLTVAPGLLPRPHGLLMLLPAALAVRIALDALRDMTVDTRGSEMPRDALLREVGTALSDVLLYLPVALYPGVPGALVVVFVVLGLCSEIAGLAAAQAGAGRRRDGPMALADRAIVLGIVGMILALDPAAAGLLPWLLLPASALALATIANRVRAVLHPRPETIDADGRGD